MEMWLKPFALADPGLAVSGDQVAPFWHHTRSQIILSHPLSIAGAVVWHVGLLRSDGG